jgi:hypothetical protein
VDGSGGTAAAAGPAHVGAGVRRPSRDRRADGLKVGGRGHTDPARPVNRAALDTSLDLAPDVVKRRFAQIADGPAVPSRPPSLPEDVHAVVRHPIGGKVMTLVGGGPINTRDGRVWLTPYFIDIAPVTNQDYAHFLDLTGYCGGVGRYQVRQRSADPVTGLDPIDARAYAQWADKRLPDAVEWDEAVRNANGLEPGGVREWCEILGQPVTRGPRTPKDGFRCAASAASVLSLLAI